MKTCPSCGSPKWIESPGGNYCEVCGESVKNDLAYDDLSSGMTLEVKLFGAWRTARAEFDHDIKAYVLWLYDESGLVGHMFISPLLKMRRPE